MTIDIEFLGAARTVTGSRHLVHTPKAKVLLDCGLFQGRRQESFARNRDLPFHARDVDVAVLSHAHIDHSGALPMLVKHGFRGTIYSTPATRDLCTAMLEDAAMIQEHDARYIQKAIEHDRVPMQPVQPLYDMEDVVQTLGQMATLPYHRTQRIAEGVDLTFFDAGHVLGSAVVVLDIDDEGQNHRLVFTGDLGRKDAPILRDPEVVHGASALIMESTYGDRLHKPSSALEHDLAEVIASTYARGGKIIIPSFALERAQEVIYALKRLRTQGLLPKMPVYVDSPLTIKVTDVFRMHPDCYDAGARALLATSDSPFDFPELTYIDSVEDSRAVSLSPGPCIVISASGMCEYGRVLHHLRRSIESPKNTVVIVGFQAQHTLGRRLVEGRSRVKIFGVERDVRAKVVVLDGFSAHADQQGLIDYALALREAGPLRSVMLVHGEPPAQDTLQKQLLSSSFPSVLVPEQGQRITL